MTTILVRYSEIGLKSTPVRRKLEKNLRTNMIDMLAEDGVEAVVSIRNSRLYVDTDDVDMAVGSLRRVFGIGSLSVAETVPSDMDSLRSFVSGYSRKAIPDNGSFAVRARREGDQGYTSMELERELGSAVMDANADRNIRVDLTDPGTTIFVEVRDRTAYVFGSYIRCHAGLPVGSQGKVVARIDDDRGVASAWLMMKRGCRVIVDGGYGVDLLRPYDPHLRTVGPEGRVPNRTYGLVLGTPLSGLDDVDMSQYTVPVFFPTMGMSDGDVEDIMSTIRDVRSWTDASDVWRIS